MNYKKISYLIYYLTFNSLALQLDMTFNGEVIDI